MKIFSEILKPKIGIKSISASSLKGLIEKQSNDIKIVDVRTPREFSQQHLSKAINIDVFHRDFTKHVIKKLKKSDEIILYCRSGQRSMNAAKQLNKLGFKNLYNLKGGMISWNKI